MEFDKMFERIEKDVENCKMTGKNIGNVGLKLKSLSSLLNKANLTQEEKKIYTVKMQQITSAFKEIEMQRRKEKMDLHREMSEAKITINRYDEVTKTNVTDKDFYRRENDRLDKIINSGYNSLDNLKRQETLISGINDKLKAGLHILGMSSEFMDKIESRMGGDRSFFYLMIVLIIFLMILFKFIF